MGSDLTLLAELNLNDIKGVEARGVDLLLLQCSPRLEQMERFAQQVIGPYREAAATRRHADPRQSRPAGFRSGPESLIHISHIGKLLGR